MPQISIVLPFALPAPEFAPDLVRALTAPALAALLSRTSSHKLVALDDAVRALPHEQWLANTLGEVEDGKIALAGAVMRGFGLDPGAGTWFIINPSHIEIARSHLMMADLRHLALSDEDGRALFGAARESCAEVGLALEYGDAQTWFLRADDWSAIDTATPDTAVGMDLRDWMPTGQRAIAYRKLQNEVQMAWYTHPANAAREARGLPPINAFWLWSGSTHLANRHHVVAATGSAPPRGTHADSPKSGRWPTIATFETPGWLSALASRKLTRLSDIASGVPEDTLLICDNVSAPAIAADWGGWLQQMQRLEAELFAPLLDALMHGRVNQVELVLSHRHARAEFTTTAMAQRKFWRRPTLERLT
jgi:hypothetical protein